MLCVLQLFSALQSAMLDCLSAGLQLSNCLSEFAGVKTLFTPSACAAHRKQALCMLVCPLSCRCVQQGQGLMIRLAHCGTQNQTKRAQHA